MAVWIGAAGAGVLNVIAGRGTQSSISGFTLPTVTHASQCVKSQCGDEMHGHTLGRDT